MGTIYTTTGSQNINADAVGTLASPTSGTVTAVTKRLGHFFSIDFTLTAARIVVTDGAASGSHGALKLMDLIEGGFHFIASRQNYTAYAEGSALTTAAGDAVFDIGVGTAAIAAAADGVLTASATYDNIGAKVDQTLSGGTTTGSLFDPCDVSVDGTGTALDIVLNWSGTAATIDATSYIDVTGTITVVGCYLGDD